ncbi:LysR family transcriptional regulator [Romeria aff. gracilis LEGE 07310]|uniref:LysR family transcriptional regulator n=1 Tax=Vasconcelosia minhoensis LEGE 07310 TaxID=915328 RepID=A0A8J7AQE3_9CYAN|nr:LysR family transcriptional regulator [Romeria gracilis]MBE9078714.1 LysR family transcriptional regulator [Romeria aff. gracilis LEGE 07310]
MNIFHLEVLAAVAEYGTFSDAAINLEISQSAVSRAVASLEAELGVPLMTRGRFGAKLTPVGERVIGHSRKILDLKEQIDYEANLEKGLYNSRLRISSFRSAATHLLPANIARFRKQFPHVEVTLAELDPAGVEQSLREGQTDLGLIPLPRSEEFKTWEIARDEYVVLLPKSEPPPPKTLTWDDLSAYSFILFNYAECTSAVRDHWSRWGQSFDVAYVIKEDSTIVSMVAQGLGAAILPRLAALPIPAGVHVRSLPIRLNRVIGAAILASTPPAPAVRMFLDVLREQGKFAA